MSRVIVPTRGTVYVEVTQYDTATLFEFQLLDVNDNPQDLSNIIACTWSMRRKIDGLLVQSDVAVVITDAANGEGTVRPNVYNRGTFTGQFTVTFNDVEHSQLRFPNGWDLVIKVRKSTGPAPAP